MLSWCVCVWCACVQGGCQAIEDAYILSQRLGQLKVHLPSHLARSHIAPTRLPHSTSRMLLMPTTWLAGGCSDAC